MIDKLEDAIIGLSVGDALGVPFEFMHRNTFKCTDMIGGGYHNQPAGTWSDDTSMTIATCASIKKKGCVDCIDIRKEFEEWYFNNKYTPFGEVFDCGNTCSGAICDKIGYDSISSNGNGSLMRILPLAFTDASDEIIGEVSSITHAHAISKEGCTLYVNIARDILHGIDIRESLRKIPLESIYADASHIWDYTVDEIVSSGYVVDSFEAAMWCLCNTDNYKDCVLSAVNLGDDTDTIAAIAGGIAGIMYGKQSIPKEWIEKLQHKEIIYNTLF